MARVRSSLLPPSPLSRPPPHLPSSPSPPPHPSSPPHFTLIHSHSSSSHPLPSPSPLPCLHHHTPPKLPGARDIAPNRVLAHGITTGQAFTPATPSFSFSSLATSTNEAHAHTLARSTNSTCSHEGFTRVSQCLPHTSNAPPSLHTTRLGFLRGVNPAHTPRMNARLYTRRASSQHGTAAAHLSLHIPSAGRCSDGMIAGSSIASRSSRNRRTTSRLFSARGGARNLQRGVGRGGAGYSGGFQLEAGGEERFVDGLGMLGT